MDLEPASYLCCGLLTFECLKGYLSLKGGAVLLATLLHLLLLRAYFVILGAGTDLSYLSEILGPSHKFCAANGGGVPFKLTVVATDVVVKRDGAVIRSGNDIMALLMARPLEKLQPTPEHAVVIKPGKAPLNLVAGLKLLKTPEELGVKDGDTVTFTALFKAEAVEGPGPGPITPPAGMVSWWPGDGNANDIVGGNHGELMGGATFAPGMVGQAFSFDTSLNSGVTVSSSANLNITDAITIDAWVKPSSFPNAYPTVVRQDRTAGGFVSYALAVTHQGQAHCNINSSRAVEQLVGGTVPLNKWTHLACTYDRVTIRTYVNGKEVATGSLSESIISSSLPLSIGGKEYGSTVRRYFDGLIDEVELFNRALSAAEIKAIYDAGSAGKIKPRGIEWPVSDGGNGHFYTLTSRPSNWLEAAAEAVSIEGHLVSINDALEQQFIVETFLSGDNIDTTHWIGCTRPVDQ